MAYSVTVSGRQMILESCCNCGVEFCFPEAIYRDAQDNKGPNGRSIKCPNGHGFHYTGETEAEKMRRQRDQARQEVARVEQEKADALAKADKADRALKRHKKRSAAGTCPCCQRTFANMAQHMKQQHPAYVRDQGAKVVPLKAREIA